MLLIERPQTDPYFNIAAEEYFLRTLEEDCFMLWSSTPSVILGKHQNAFAEINRRYVKEHNIPVIRRISGGGTVFHDPGNLNFTFIAGGEKEKLVDFRKFTQPVIDYLVSLGLPARFEGKNDIRINGLKVSGNAEHVFRDRVLHHGTLLFSSRLDNLNEAIKGREELYLDKAVRSVRSTVANISGLLSDRMSLTDFRQGIIRRLEELHPNLRKTAMTPAIERSISNLVESKYRTWEWNYGYSPGFTFQKKVRFDDLDILVALEVRNGIIRDVKVSGRGSGRLPFESFKGVRLEEDRLMDHYPHSPFSEILDMEAYRRLLITVLY